MDNSALERAQVKIDSPETEAAIVAKLSVLGHLEYDKQRKPAAEKLGVSVTALDAAVKAVRKSEYPNGTAVLFNDLDPWPDPVNGAELLDDIASYVSKYLALPDHADTVMALWAAHAHAHEAFEHTPRLNLTALEKNCGKTTALDVLATLTPKAIRTENVSTAVLFRLITRDSPTLLIDEYDSALKENEELRGALNAGHKRGGMFLRCEGDNNEPTAFKTFAPVALAGIGALPGTLLDRSIVVNLKRAMPHEIKDRFDLRKLSDQRLKRKLARWVADNMLALASCDPVMPEDFYNRRADKWRPLFAVAEVAGGKWPQHAKEAALELSINEDSADSIRIQLLGALRAMFKRFSRDSLATQEILEELVKDDEAPWKEFNSKNGKPITARNLAKLLKPFGLVPGAKRAGKEVFKGYHAKDFNDAFSRFLPPEMSVTELHDCSSTVLQFSDRLRVTEEKTGNSLGNNVCNRVTDKTGGLPEEPVIAELKRLIGLIADGDGHFTTEDIAEELKDALNDPERALVRYRAILREHGEGIA